MKKLYDEFFRVSNDEKVKDKVMIARTALTAVIMAICLIAMSFSAFAYFSHDSKSAGNTIQCASFDITVTVSEVQNGVVAASSGVTPEPDRYSFKVEKNKTYSVTISRKESSTATTGFCIVSANGSSDTYHTIQLGKDVNANQQVTSVTFTLTATADTTVYFTPNWGTSSRYMATYSLRGEEDYYILDGEAIKFTVAANGNNVESTDKPEETTGAPETTGTPETTAKPEESKAPETTAKPVETKKPETTAAATESATTAPDTTAAPDTTTVAPEATTAAPETTAEVTTAESTTATPETDAQAQPDQNSEPSPQNEGGEAPSESSVVNTDTPENA